MGLEENSVAATSLSATGKSSVLGWGMVLLFVALNILGALLLKNQIQKLGSYNFTALRSSLLFFLKMFSSLQTLLALGSLFASTVAWTIALANLELSRAYPVGIGLHFLAIMTSSMVFYGESFTAFKVLGIVFILFGVVFVLK